MKKSESLEKKLKAYSLTAGAILTGVTSLNAQIAYTDVDPDAVINTGGATFDIVFSGETKFKIKYTTDTTFPGFVSVGILPQTASASFVYYPQGFYNFASAFNSSESIGSGANFTNQGQPNNLGFVSTFSTTFFSGAFVGTTDKYIGVRFKISGNTHYGWVQVQIPNTIVDEAVITGYAYEQTPGLAIHSGSVPVELASFTANAVENGIRLIWETATETNNKGFEVERCLMTGDDKSKKWEKAGYMEGNGNTAERQHYEFTDRNISGGTKFLYRLKQIDFNGSFEYSDELEVNIIPTGYSLDQNYPNPFNPSTNIRFTIPEESKVKLTLFNVLGKEVRVLVDELKPAGIHEVELHGSGLANGTYFYRLETEKYSSTKKMSLLK